LEALIQGRNIIANDLSPYAAVLTQAKLFPPPSESVAIRKALRYVREAKKTAKERHYRTDAPKWVRQFFHRKTLAEASVLTKILLKREEWFLLACVLGILHHQRPGFLSFPSSHLVPYLRAKKFPRAKFASLYAYRDLEPRILAKIRRAYKRTAVFDKQLLRQFTRDDIRNLIVPRQVDLLLTSPPYMNALDYGRDNRLRLWFLGLEDYRDLDRHNCRTPAEFEKLMQCLADLADQCVSPTGTVALVVGEVRRKSFSINTAEIVMRVFTEGANFRLVDSIKDLVPDLRRCRRNYCTTKREWVLIFKRKKSAHE